MIADRTCPRCGKDRLCSGREARQVFQTGGWGATALLEDAELVCSFCHAVKVNGEWDELQSVESRAWNLSQASSSKNKAEYEAILTAGEGFDNTESENDRPSVEADDW